MNNSASGLYQSNGMISQYMPDNGVTAKSNMVFQEYLSNTALQRQMADAKAAGLNPWLMHLSGASTPSGATDSGDVMAMLNSSSAKSGSMSNEGEGFLYNLFLALGFKKQQAYGLAESLHSMNLTDEQALQYGMQVLGIIGNYFGANNDGSSSSAKDNADKKTTIDRQAEREARRETRKNDWKDYLKRVDEYIRETW